MKQQKDDSAKENLYSDFILKEIYHLFTGKVCIIWHNINDIIFIRNISEIEVSSFLRSPRVHFLALCMLFLVQQRD
jgi:hypothetical protein